MGDVAATATCELGAVFYPITCPSRVWFQSPHSERVEGTDVLDVCVFGGGRQHLLFLEVYVKKIFP